MTCVWTQQNVVCRTQRWWNRIVILRKSNTHDSSFYFNSPAKNLFRLIFSVESFSCILIGQQIIVFLFLRHCSQWHAADVALFIWTGTVYGRFQLLSMSRWQRFPFRFEVDTNESQYTRNTKKKISSTQIDVYSAFSSCDINTRQRVRHKHVYK